MLNRYTTLAQETLKAEKAKRSKQISEEPFRPANPPKKTAGNLGSNFGTVNYSGKPKSQAYPLGARIEYIPQGSVMSTSAHSHQHRKLRPLPVPTLTYSYLPAFSLLYCATHTLPLNPKPYSIAQSTPYPYPVSSPPFLLPSFHPLPPPPTPLPPFLQAEQIKKGSIKHAPPNIVTNPIKKGSFGQPNTTIGVPPSGGDRRAWIANRYPKP